MYRILCMLLPFVCLLGAEPGTAPAAMPLSLRDAVALSLRQNPDVQIANLAILEADGGLSQVRSQLLPQVGAQAIQRRQTLNLRGIGLSFPGVPALVGPFSAFDARPTVSQTLLDVSAWKAVEAARARVRQAEAGSEAVRQATVLSVISVYLQALEIDSRIEASRARLGSAEAVEQQVRSRYEAGAASKLDLSRAVLQVQNERAFLRRAEGLRAVTLQGLLRLIGQQENAQVHLADALPVQAAAVMELSVAEQLALDSNPELRSLRMAADAARADGSQAKLQRLPRLRFLADYGANGQTPSASLGTYQYAGQVEFPIFTSGRIRGEIQAASARQRSAEQAVRGGHLKVLSELRGAHAECLAAASAADAAEAAVDAARDNLDLSRARYEAGIADSVSVLQAQATLADVENLRIGAIIEREIARARVLFAAGDVLPFVQ
ncbi:MAG: TolC family protein [Bryobacterales bacterium]|jgi:outer membrane protein TolC|nr:TolC family protein [Bryobacterales bacterium]